jgi:hypothetical protein
MKLSYSLLIYCKPEAGDLALSPYQRSNSVILMYLGAVPNNEVISEVYAKIHYAGADYKVN